MSKGKTGERLMGIDQIRQPSVDLQTPPIAGQVEFRKAILRERRSRISHSKISVGLNITRTDRVQELSCFGQR